MGNLCGKTMPSVEAVRKISIAISDSEPVHKVGSVRMDLASTWPKEWIAELEVIIEMCDKNERFLVARKLLNTLEERVGSESELGACFVEEVVNNNEIVRRLRWKCGRLDRLAGQLEGARAVMKQAKGKVRRGSTVVVSPALGKGKGKSVKGPDWRHENFGVGRDLCYYVESDGTCLMMVTGQLNEPLVNIAALLNEVDLQPGFVPYLEEAERVHSVQGCGDHGQVLVRMVFSPPSLKDRETNMFAFVCDAAEDERFNGFVLLAESIPPELSSWWGYPLPRNQRRVQMDMKTLGFILKPTEDGKSCDVCLLIHADMKVPFFVPKTIVKWGSKWVAKSAFSSMEAISKKFDTSQYPKRIEDNPSFYRGFVEERIIPRFQGNQTRRASFVSCLSEDDQEPTKASWFSFSHKTN